MTVDIDNSEKLDLTYGFDSFQNRWLRKTYCKNFTDMFYPNYKPNRYYGIDSNVAGLPPAGNPVIPNPQPALSPQQMVNPPANPTTGLVNPPSDSGSGSPPNPLFGYFPYPLYPPYPPNYSSPYYPVQPVNVVNRTNTMGGISREKSISGAKKVATIGLVAIGAIALLSFLK